MAPSNGNGSPPFTRERRIVGVLMLATVSLLAILDAVPAINYTPDNVLMLLLAGTGSVLLGVEAFRKLVG